MKNYWGSKHTVNAWSLRAQIVESQFNSICGSVCLSVNHLLSLSSWPPSGSLMNPTYISYHWERVLCGSVLLFGSVRVSFQIYFCLAFILASLDCVPCWRALLKRHDQIWFSGSLESVTLVEAASAAAAAAAANSNVPNTTASTRACWSIP